MFLFPIMQTSLRATERIVIGAFATEAMAGHKMIRRSEIHRASGLSLPTITSSLSRLSAMGCVDRTLDFWYPVPAVLLPMLIERTVPEDGPWPLRYQMLTIPEQVAGLSPHLNVLYWARRAWPHLGKSDLARVTGLSNQLICRRFDQCGRPASSAEPVLET